VNLDDVVVVVGVLKTENKRPGWITTGLVAAAIPAVAVAEEVCACRRRLDVNNRPRQGILEGATVSLDDYQKLQKIHVKNL